MKEFYMTVSPDCALYRDFFAWVEDSKKIVLLIGQLLRDEFYA